MKKPKEKEMLILRGLAVVIALAAGVLGVLYLSGIFQALWCLNCVLTLGVLFHCILAVLSFLRQWKTGTAILSLCAAFYLTVLVYFNVL